MDDQAYNPRYHRIIYEELCADPITETEKLFHATGLSLDGQTIAFLEQSLSSKSGDTSYFGVVRNPLAAANRWKTQLPPEIVDRVRTQVAKTATGKLFFS